MVTAKLKALGLTWKIAVWVVSFLFACIGIHQATLFFAPEPVVFKNIQEFRDFAIANHLIVTNEGLLAGGLGKSCYVSDRAVTFDDIVLVSKHHACGLTPAWKGIVWACQVHSDIETLDTDSIGGKRRVWGNVIVAGDEDLMDRMESQFRIR